MFKKEFHTPVLSLLLNSVHLSASYCPELFFEIEKLDYGERKRMAGVIRRFTEVDIRYIYSRRITADNLHPWWKSGIIGQYGGIHHG